MALAWAATHGTLSCYKSGCRQPECAQAERDYTNSRRRLRAYGRPTTNLVNADPARQHAKALMNLGWGIAALQEAAGGNMMALIYGRPASGKPPLARITETSSRKLLSIPLELIPTTNLVDASGVRRRSRAMCVLGYSLAWQAAEVGVVPSIVQYLASGATERTQAKTAWAIRGVYDRVWQAPALDGVTARITQKRAAEKGWLPPLAWDDDLIDLPEADLEAEIARRVSAMDDAELRRCASAYKAEGDRTPLISAAARVWRRRLESAA